MSESPCGGFPSKLRKLGAQASSAQTGLLAILCIAAFVGLCIFWTGV